MSAYHTAVHAVLCCACSGCDVFTPMCQSHHWRGRVVWRPVCLWGISRPAARLHQLQPLERHYQHICTVPRLCCSLSEKSTENMYISKFACDGPARKAGTSCPGPLQQYCVLNQHTIHKARIFQDSLSASVFTLKFRLSATAFLRLRCWLSKDKCISNICSRLLG